MRAKFFVHSFFILVIMTASLASAALLEDDFSTLDTDGTWTAFNTVGSYAPSIVFPDKLRLRVTNSNPGKRTLITSQANNLNPFNAALTMNLNNLSMSSAAPSGAGASMFFAIVGEQNADDASLYYPAVENFNTAGALALTVQLTSSGYQMEVFDYGTSVASQSFALEGMPVDLAWIINGGENTWSVEISGTTFSGGGTTQAGTFANYTEGSVSRLSLGSINYGGASGDFSDGTAYYLDALDVLSAVPEPASIGLWSISGVMMFALRYYRLL